MTNPVTFDDLIRLLFSWLCLSVIGLLFKKQLITLSRPILFGILLRLLLSWTMLSIIGLIYCREIMRFFIPCLSWAINLIQDDYSAILQILDRDGGQLLLLATLSHDILPLVKEDKVSVLRDIMHFVMPLVAFLSLFFAWPAKGLQSRIRLLLLAVPLTLGWVVLTAPFQLAAATEAVFQTFSQPYQIIREKPSYLIWAHCLDNGGRWLRSIALAWLGLVLVQRLDLAAMNDKR